MLVDGRRHRSFPELVGFTIKRDRLDRGKVHRADRTGLHVPDRHKVRMALAARLCGSLVARWSRVVVQLGFGNPQLSPSTNIRTYNKKFNSANPLILMVPPHGLEPRTY